MIDRLQGQIEELQKRLAIVEGLLSKESPQKAWERGYDEGRSDGEKEASGGPHYPVPSYDPKDAL